MDRRRPTSETPSLPVVLPVRPGGRRGVTRGRSACVRSRTKLIVISAAGLVGLAAASPMIANAATQAPQKMFSVESFGAKGDGKTDSAPATNAAIAAAARNGGGAITLRAGTFKIAGTAHLGSNTRINAPTRSTIPRSAGRYSPAQSNPHC